MKTLFSLTLIAISVCSPVRASAAVDHSRKVGITHWDGKYNFTPNPYTREGADGVAAMGSHVIKMGFSLKNYAAHYPFNHSWPSSYTDFVAMASSTSFANVFGDPRFSTIVLVTFGNAPDNDPNTWCAGALNTTQKTAISSQYQALTQHLRTTYNGTGKTFVFQNWEGDNALAECFNFNPTTGPAAVSYTGMRDWLQARQDGVTAGRAIGTSDVIVVAAAEWNKPATNYGWSVANHVFPNLTMDLYSWSNWNYMTDPAAVIAELNYVDSKVASSAIYGSKNLAVGEFGDWENGNDEETQLLMSKVELEAALSWGVQYAIYWEMFCNVWLGAPASPPTNASLKGFWMVRPDGTLPLVNNYARALFNGQTTIDYLNDWTTTLWHDPNMVFDTGNVSMFKNDPSRIKRLYNVPMTVSYALSRDAVSFEVDVYARTTSITSYIVAGTSPNNSTWTTLPITTVAPATATASGWYHATVIPQGSLPTGTRYVRFTMQNDALIYSPQIGQVKIEDDREFGGPYRLLHQQSARCIDSANGQGSNGVQSVIYDCSSTNVNQKWTFNGTQIQLNGTTKCLEDKTGAGLAGDVVSLATCNNSAAQTWEMKALFGSYGNLKLASANLCVSTPNGVTANSTGLTLATCGTGQNLNFQLQTPTGATTALLGDQSGRCIDTNGGQSTNGVQLVIKDCVAGTANQTWAFSGTQIKLNGTNKCLTDRAGTGTVGDVIELRDCGSAGQSWMSTTTRGFRGTLRMTGTGNCVTLANGATGANSVLTLGACTSNGAQDKFRTLWNQ